MVYLLFDLSGVVGSVLKFGFKQCGFVVKTERCDLGGGFDGKWEFGETDRIVFA